MIDPDHIHSLTDFQRNAKKHIQRLRRTGKPGVLTVNGRATVIVQDPQSYAVLLEKARRADLTESIEQGLANMRAGRGRPLDQVMRELRARAENRLRASRRRSA